MRITRKCGWCPDFSLSLGCVAILCFLALYLGLWGGNTPSPLFVCGVCVLLVGALFLLCYTLWYHTRAERKLTPAERKEAVLFAVLADVFCLAYLCSFFREAPRFRDFAVLALLLAVAAASTAFCALRVPAKRPRSARALLPFLPYLLLAVALFLLNLPSLRAFPRWDSYNYYLFTDAIDRDSFTSMVEFRLANHLAYAVSLIVFVFNSFCPDHLLAGYLLNYAMVFGGALLVARIVRRICPSAPAALRVAAACLYAFSPYTFGVSYVINLESFLLFGMVLFFCGEASDLPFVSVLGGLLVCFGKENGAPALAVAVVVHLIFRLREKGEPILRRLDLAVTAPILGAGLIWLFDMLRMSWISTNDGAVSTVDGIAFNSVALSATYVKDKFVSTFFTQFTWLVLLLAVGVAILLLFRRFRTEEAKNCRVPTEILAFSAVTLAMGFAIVTYNHIRYNMVFVGAVYLLFVILVGWLRLPTAARTAALAACAAVLLAQCYVTADPLMRAMLPSVGVEGETLVHSPNHIINTATGEGETPLPFCDCALYNRQMLYFDTAFDTLIREAGYTGDTYFAMSGEYRYPTVGGYVASLYLLSGYGYGTSPEIHALGWDTARGAREVTFNPSAPFALNEVTRDNFRDVLTEHGEALYIRFPFKDRFYEDYIVPYAEYEKAAEVTVHGWKLTAYRVTALSETAPD